MSVTNINIRVDSDIKTQAQDVLASLGLNMTTAINIFLRQAISQHSIPFVISTEPAKKAPKPGCMKGKIWVADDFDAPLEDFKDYMQ
ncbi:MAG: type II toxin-antitoxin system RelB/DinJ family antitoxin [Treponema sp.]|jgi:DNA-damage-inducible protein J|nr:type II toxin-antitoxin system RelB/DinJ family antitoxin [Treponema sp.]